MMRTLRVAIPVVVVWLFLSPFSARPHAFGKARVTALAVTERSVQDWDRTVTDMVRSGQLRRREVVDDTLIAGRAHERFDEYYNGIRVFGGNSVRQMAGDQAVSIFSQLHPDISLDPTPRLSQDDVTASVSRLANGEKPAGDPELVILPLDSNQYALAYRVRVNTPTDRIVYFVDANSGEVRWQYSDVERQSAVGSGTGVFGDKEKVSASAFGGMFVAEDLLRPPSIATFDLKGNVSRGAGVPRWRHVTGGRGSREQSRTTPGQTVPTSMRTSMPASPTITTSSASAVTVWTTMTFPSPC